MKLKKRIDFEPDNVKFYERPISIDVDWREKMESCPEFRERYRFEAKKIGVYSPAKKIIPQNIIYNQQNLIPQNNENNYLQQYNSIDEERNVSVNYLPSSGKFPSIRPESIFNIELKEIKKLIFIKNQKEGPVVIGFGSGKDESNRYIIKKYESIFNVPQYVYENNSFRKLFFGKRPILVFITEDQYEYESPLYEKYLEDKKNHIEELRKNSKKGKRGADNFASFERIEGGDIDMYGEGYEEDYYDGKEEYDDGFAIHMDMTGDFSKQGHYKEGLSSLSNVMNDDDVMSDEDVRSLLGKYNI